MSLTGEPDGPPVRVGPSIADLGAAVFATNLIIPERLRGRHWEGYDKVMGGAQSRYGSGALRAVRALHKDGRQISIEFTILPLRGDAGTLLGIAAFLRDATAHFEEVRALRRELAVLKQGS